MRLINIIDIDTTYFFLKINRFIIFFFMKNRDRAWNKKYIEQVLLLKHNHVTRAFYTSNQKAKLKIRFFTTKNPLKI